MALTPMQQRILQFLADADDWRTRQDMYDFVGTTKGYSLALGAPTGKHHPNSLEARGLVQRRGGTRFSYKISPAGLMAATTNQADDGKVIPWRERDRDLETKLRRLYETHLRSWMSSVGETKFEQKWHVGRALLEWFYANNLLGADELEALNVKHSRPNKPNYEMYRIIWKYAGRASDEVAAICTARRTGPPKGYTRRRIAAVADSRVPALASSAAQLKAEKEFFFGNGGWLYAYAYARDLAYCESQNREPIIKVGHTSTGYWQRVEAQTRRTEVPDLPRILRAYQVSNSAAVELAVHERLKAEGRHHRSAGGSEWFTVKVDRLDAIVLEVIRGMGA